MADFRRNENIFAEKTAEYGFACYYREKQN